MKLFTSAIDKQLFAQYNMGNDLESQKVVAKIFNPYGKGTWYLLNSDPNDPDYIWAIVDLLDIEMGSVSRSELESIKVPPFRLPLERDTSFTPINALELYRGLNQGKRYANGGTTGYNADVEIVENKIGKNYLFPKDSNPDTMGIEFARGGNIKSFRKDEAFRLTPYNSIERSIMDRVPNEQEYKLAGNFFIKGHNNDAYIYFLDEFDRNYVKGVEIKPNERIYRYITRNSAIGGMMPLVKINVENGLVYYPIFKDEDVLVGFDKKGQKTEYLNLIEVDESDYYANGGVIGGLTADEAIYLYVKKAIVQKYREKYLKPAGLWNTDKAKEVEKSLIKKGFLNSAGSINEVGKNKANQVDSSIGLMISRGYLSSTNLPSKYKEIVEKFETIDKMERGGKIDDENKEMLKNQSVEIMHHAKELEDVVKKTDGVEPWVIAKVERSATDLSDVTHYLEGESKKMAKGGELYVDLFEERDGMPYEVKEVLERYEEEYGEDITYEALLQMQEDMENVGYTFDYGLDAIPYGLRPIGVEITQLRDYDDDEYAYGGMIAKTFEVEYEINGKKEKSLYLLYPNDRVENLLPPTAKIISIKEKMAKGGELYVDLFEDRDGMPYEVKEVLERYEDEYGEDITYEALLQMQEDMENVGYTFDYGLDAIPYGLRPIGVEITQLRDYDDDEYANGGIMAKGGEISVKVGDKVKSKSGIEGEVYQSMGTFFKLKDKYGNKGQKFYSTRDFKPSEIKIMAEGGMMEKGGDLHKDSIYLINVTTERVSKRSRGAAYNDKGSGANVVRYTLQEVTGDIKDLEKNKTILKITNQRLRSLNERGGKLGLNAVGALNFFKKYGYDFKIDHKLLKGNENMDLKKVSNNLYLEKNKRGTNLSEYYGDEPAFVDSEVKKRFEENKQKEMAMGGKVKFADKVKSIKKSLLERKKVSPKVQKDYGKTYSPKEAEESAKRIVGSLTAREKMKSKMKK